MSYKCVWAYVHACVWCVFGKTTHIATFFLGARFSSPRRKDSSNFTDCIWFLKSLKFNCSDLEQSDKAVDKSGVCRNEAWAV